MHETKFHEEDNKKLVEDLRVAAATGLDGSPGDPLAARALEALMGVKETPFAAPTPKYTAGQLVCSTRRVALSNKVVLQLIERDNELCLALENEHTDMPDAYIASITPDGVLIYGNSGDACDVLTRGLVSSKEETQDTEVELYFTADGGSTSVYINDVASGKKLCGFRLGQGVTYGVPVRGEVEIVTTRGEFLSVEKGGAIYTPSRSGVVTLRIP